MRTNSAFIKNALKWLTLFTVLVAAPLILALTGHAEENRGFWIEFGVGLGFVGLAMMGLQFVLTARYSKIGAPFGLDELLQFHGQAGYVAWVFIMGHFVILLLADSEFIKFLDPTVNLPRAIALSGVIIAITVIIVTTHWRAKFKIAYEWWRVSHGTLALFVVFVGTVHIMQVGFYISEPWQQALWVSLSIAAMGMLIHNRVWRPIQMKKKPWTVTSVKKETHTIWSVELEPAGHNGIEFKAGQFVWITFGKSPFSLQQHPFTISSSPKQNTLRLTIKELGDFTTQIKEIEPGTNAFVEGPFGNFTLDSASSTHNVFIVGGIGITPAISMLQAMSDMKSERKATLIYGTPSKEMTPFFDELQTLSEKLNLNVVHVFEEAPDNRDGETGFITAEIIKRHIPDDFSNCEFFICGPPPMMDAVETTVAGWGVPIHLVHSERFNIV